ncbi:MAG: AEC family transporter [Clostridia bacterium]|nr:AEC family transporter [Clostridia bacterium]
MPSMNVVFTQILVILLYILIGYAAGKLRLINADQRKYLSTICTNLILPFTILSASNQTISHNQMAELGLSFLLMLGLFIATTTIAMLVQRHTPRPLKVTTTSLVTYPNCTFLGLPLCRALFGDIAILYNAVAMVAFNVLFFTWQSSAFTGKSFRPRNLATPGTIATALLLLMLFAGIQFPAPVQTVVSSTGAMITPLSLIIIGVMMSENRLVLILKERRAYVITLVRNLTVPLVALLILITLPGDGPSKLCQLVYMACPCATLTSIYAIQNDMEPELAARSVLLSTLAFALTLPLVIAVGMRVWG